MDMRTRIERKLDKLNSVKRKNWEIEAKLKYLNVNTMVFPKEEKENIPEDSPQTSSKPKRRGKSVAKRIPKVQMSRAKETQTLLQRNFEFNVIGSGRPSFKADSAGHKFDNCYFMRTEQRIKIMNALISDGIPTGAMNPMSIAIRIESAIYRLLCEDSRAYEQYCNQCSQYIEMKRKGSIRYDLLIGHLDPDQFVFIPRHGSQYKEVIEMRVHLREEEEKEKIKLLKKGIV